MSKGSGLEVVLDFLDLLGRGVLDVFDLGGGVVGGMKKLIARSTVQAAALPLGARIEIDVIAAAGASVDFALLPERSEMALTDLARQGRTFGLTFIDGYHRFDDVLVDFTLAARMCPEGGVIVLHDMWLPSIAAVASFLRTNRVDFAEVQTGCPNLFAMRRIADDERDWTHFVAFPLR